MGTKYHRRLKKPLNIHIGGQRGHLMITYFFKALLTWTSTSSNQK